MHWLLFSCLLRSISCNRDSECAVLADVPEANTSVHQIENKEDILEELALLYARKKLCLSALGEVAKLIKKWGMTVQLIQEQFFALRVLPYVVEHSIISV